MKKTRTDLLASREKRLLDQCRILAETIRVLKPLYYSPSTNTNQIRLLETMIGAAIWYLPLSPDLWTGFASEGALKDLKKATKEHQLPRKMAAQELFKLSDAELNGDTIHRLYKEKYGRFNRVTKAENSKLRKFQKSNIFASPSQCYSQAGIELIKVDEFARFVARQGKTSSASTVELRDAAHNE